MRVLIGAESSGRVRDAFRRRGHDAKSCDLLPDEQGSPHHMQCDILSVLDDGWDLLVVHLPCTYFCNSAVWAFTRTPPNPSPGVKYGAARVAAFEEAVQLWLRVRDCGIPRIAMENPVAHGRALAAIGRPTQSIQPYQFGDDASKRTCLWLKGLPPLVVPHEERWVAPRIVGGKPRWGNQTDGGYNALLPSPTRWRDRSRTYLGIAEAMAEQWGGSDVEPSQADLPATDYVVLSPLDPRD
jgi:hypothetical protein